MNFIKYSLVVASVLSAVAQAQYDSGASEELNFLDESVQTEPNIEFQEAAPQRRSQSARVYKQPRTYIEDTELPSKGEQSLKQLNDEILKTNDAVITEINKTRLDEEAQRRDKFIGRVQGLGADQTQEQAPVVVQPAPVQVLPQESDLDREAMESRLSALETLKQDEKTYSEKTYFQAILGFTEISEAANVKADASMGFGVGMKYKERILVEGNFIYSSYLKDFPYQTDIEQYTGLGSIKYQMFNGVLRPVVGASIAYNHRTFTDELSFSGESASSNSIDWGLLGGVDVELSDSFSVGTEFRYMWNLMNRTDGSYPYMGIGEQPFDEFNYYVMSVSGRFLF